MNFPLEFNSSVAKRVNMDWDVFHEAIERSGFEHVSSVAGGRIHYHENEAGFSITLIDGPRANLILPSGPFRGRIFGNSGLSLGSDRDKLEVLAEEVRNADTPNSDDSTGSRGRRGSEVTA